MQICDVCKEQIIKGDSIVSLSFPLKIISDNCDYSLEQFYLNEKFIHVGCYYQEVDCKPFIEILSQIGEKVNENEIKQFLRENQNLQEDKLIKEYFLQKRY